MSATPKLKPDSRRREVPLKVYCLPHERAAIETNARLSGKSVSTYLRLVGTGMEVRSTLDQNAMRELAKVNADQGRMGGLLKALLTNEERFDGYTGRQLQKLTEGTLRDIAETQTLLRHWVDKLFSR